MSPCIFLVFHCSAILQLLYRLYLPILSAHNFTILLKYISAPGAFPIFSIIHTPNSLCLSSLFQAISRGVELISIILTHAMVHSSVAEFPAPLHTLHVQGVWCGPSEPGSHISAECACLHNPLGAYPRCSTVPARDWASRALGWQRAHLRWPGAQLAASVPPEWAGECHCWQGPQKPPCTPADCTAPTQAACQERWHFIFSVIPLHNSFTLYVQLTEHFLDNV